MGDLLRSFLGSMRVRTKHIGKTHVGLCGQSSIWKAAVTFSIRALTQPEVRSTADEDNGPLKGGMIVTINPLSPKKRTR